MDPARYFSDCYGTARARFSQACKDRGIGIETVPIDGAGPDGSPLGIDIAWIGSPKPGRVLLHTSGLHGIEGFVGSAIQLHALASLPAVGPDVALVLVHGLNPWGMAWLRRTNANNVDLNRNFPTPDQRWSGASESYLRLSDFLNPPSPPGGDDFVGAAEQKVGQMGRDAFIQAVAGGQHEIPHGLFFGGHSLEQEPIRFAEWVQARLGDSDLIFGIDVHSGIGPRGEESIFTEAEVPVDGPLLDLLRARKTATVPYETTGAFAKALPLALTGRRVVPLTQEFGTEPPLSVLHALREENRWHFHGDGTVFHPAKARLREAFVPSDPNWRQAILVQGSSLLRRVLELLDNG